MLDKPTMYSNSVSKKTYMQGFTNKTEISENNNNTLLFHNTVYQAN